ncbi:MAG TPA: ABC transporter substrate-binding protein [Azospirillum sp.]|nr:ABC transporter substrate-binding protein [Azospirillum sp.]
MSLKSIMAAAALAAATAGAAVPSQAADPLKIGVLFPLSGPMALIGNEAYQAAEVARDMINKRGGVLGRPVTYAVADAPAPTAANAEATRLIVREKVPVIAGSYASSLALAASEVAEREGALYWETIAVADKITQRKYKNTIRLTFNASMMGQTAADFAKDIAGKLGKDPKDLRIAVISEDSEFGQSVGDAAANRTKTLGMQLVANERYSRTVNDLSSLVLSLKAARPDAVIATSYLNDAALFWRQARELDLHVPAMIGIGTGYALPDFLAATGASADGIFDVDAPASPNVSNLPEPTQKLYAEFIEGFRAKEKRDPGPLGLIAFGGFWTLFTDVIPRAGSTDLAALRKAAYATDLPDGSLLTGAGVKLNQIGEKEAGQNSRALISVMQWQDGKLQVVWPQSAANSEMRKVPLPKWSER